MECFSFQNIRDKDELISTQSAHPFTQRAGIPCRSIPPEELPQGRRKEKPAWVFQAHEFTYRAAPPPPPNHVRHDCPHGP